MRANVDKCATALLLLERVSVLYSPVEFFFSRLSETSCERNAVSQIFVILFNVVINLAVKCGITSHLMINMTHYNVIRYGFTFQKHTFKSISNGNRNATCHYVYKYIHTHTKVVVSVAFMPSSSASSSALSPSISSVSLEISERIIRDNSEHVNRLRKRNQMRMFVE